MKTKLLLTLAFVLGFSYHHWAQQASLTNHPEPEYPYVEIIITQEKVWLMPDEQPVANVPVKVINASGEVILQKNFCSESKEWSLDVSGLPSGKYKIQVGATQTEYLEKQGKRKLL